MSVHTCMCVYVYIERDTEGICNRIDADVDKDPSLISKAMHNLLFLTRYLCVRSCVCVLYVRVCMRERERLYSK